MGKIQLEGIEVMVRIGLLEEEQFAPQDLYVTLELSYDFSSILESDEITYGIDYREIVEFVREFSNAYDGKTLERFAHLLAVELKEKFDFSKVRLSVDKRATSKSSACVKSESKLNADVTLGLGRTWVTRRKPSSYL